MPYKWHGVVSGYFPDITRPSLEARGKATSFLYFWLHTYFTHTHTCIFKVFRWNYFSNPIYVIGSYVYVYLINIVGLDTKSVNWTNKKQYIKSPTTLLIRKFTVCYEWSIIFCPFNNKLTQLLLTTKSIQKKFHLSLGGNT